MTAPQATTPAQLPACDCTTYCGDDDRLAAGTVQPCAAKVMALHAVRQRDMAATLLAELEQAHGLIALLLQHLTPAARARFAAASDKAGLGTDGATRRAERAAVLAQARGEGKPCG